MEDIIPSRHLRDQYACATRRAHEFTFKTPDSLSFVLASIAKKAVVDCLFGRSSLSQAKELLVEGCKDVKGSPKEIAIKIDDTIRNLERYLNSEDRQPEKGQIMSLDVFGVPVRTSPDAIFKFEENGYHVLEVVKFRFRKAEAVEVLNEKGMELYAMLCHGRKLAGKDGGYKVRASYYYLAKRSDKLSFSQKDFVYDTDFFSGKGNSIVSIEDGGNVDSVFEPLFKRYKDGYSITECTELGICEKCEFQHVCSYAHSPIPIPSNSKSIQPVNAIKLTAGQQEAVDFDRGICRINAGAGAGKTLVVAMRVIELLKKGVKPEEICLMTYTNKAADEMLERVSAYNDELKVVKDVSGINCTTFNGFGNAIIEKEYRVMGFKRKPKVIDDVSRSIIIAKLLEDCPIDGLDNRNFAVDMVNCRGALAVAKQVFQLMKQGYGLADLDYIREKIGERFCTPMAITELVMLFDEYDAQLKAKGLIEFSDQEVMLNNFLQANPHYLDRYGFRHLIVDEFQDSADNQMALLRYFIKIRGFESLMVVGDDSQSIYGFKGANPANLIDFAEKIGVKEYKDIYLVENHRSTPEILEFANKLNEINEHRVIKDLKATRPHGVPVSINGFEKASDEQQFIVEEIQHKLDIGTRPEDIAFIAKNKAELLKVQKLLTAKGINSILLNPELLVENSRVVGALSLVRYMADPDDVKAGIVYLNAKMNGQLLDMADSRINELLKDTTEVLSSLEGLDDNSKRSKVFELIDELDDGDEVFSSFKDSISHLASYSEFVDYCLKYPIYGGSVAVKRGRDYPGVVLITAHSSKGLEWPIVYNSITKYDGTSANPLIDDEEVEEARRLFFVSVTRGRDEVYITGVYKAYGSYKNAHYNRFLQEACEIADVPYDVNGKKKTA